MIWSSLHRLDEFVKILDHSKPTQDQLNEILSEVHKVLFQHLEAEEKLLEAENMKKYWTLEEINTFKFVWDQLMATICHSLCTRGTVLPSHPNTIASDALAHTSQSNKLICFDLRFIVYSSNLLEMVCYLCVHFTDTWRLYSFWKRWTLHSQNTRVSCNEFIDNHLHFVNRSKVTKAFQRRRMQSRESCLELQQWLLSELPSQASLEC